MEYRLYDKGVLDMILRHPETARKDAYRLFTAFFWHRMKGEMYMSEYEEADPEEEDVPKYDEYDMNGSAIPERLFRSMLEESADDFIAAAENGFTVRVADKPYRIPKCSKLSRDVLTGGIFRFSTGSDGMAEIDESRIYEPVADIGSAPDEMRAGRRMFRNIVWLVDNVDDGWERLTDIEAAAYTWGLRMARYEGQRVKSVIIHALQTVTEICNTVAPFSIEELSDCWNGEYDSATVSVETQFSAEKVRRWNEMNGQKSEVQSVDAALADDWWFERGHLNFE